MAERAAGRGKRTGRRVSSNETGRQADTGATPAGKRVHRAGCRDPFFSLVEFAPEAIFIQAEGRFLYLNRRMVALFGAASPDELLGTDIFERFAPEYHDVIRSRVRALVESPGPSSLSEQEYVRIDGSRVPVETTAIPFRYEGQDAVAVFVRDIAERKKAAEKLRESEKRHRRLFEKSISPILVIDSSGNYIDCNDAALRFLETTRPELLKRNVADYIPPGQARSVLDDHSTLWERGGACRNRILHQRKDQDPRAVHQ